MSGAAEVNIQDSSSQANIPVDGIAVAASAAPTGGQAIRQTTAIGDGQGSATVADVNQLAATQGDNALRTRGLVGVEDFAVAMRRQLAAVEIPIFLESASGRVRCTLDAIASSLTLANITSVSTVTQVTNLANVGGNDAKQTVQTPLDSAAWALLVRGRIV